MNIQDLIPAKADQVDEIAELRSIIDTLSSVMIEFFDSDKERHAALDKRIGLILEQVENNTRAIDLAERILEEHDA